MKPKYDLTLPNRASVPSKPRVMILLSVLGWISLSLLLSACGETKYVTRTVYLKPDSALTEPTPLEHPWANETETNGEMKDHGERAEMALGTCNRDKYLIATMTPQVAEEEPKAPEPKKRINWLFWRKDQ